MMYVVFGITTSLAFTALVLMIAAIGEMDEDTIEYPKPFWIGLCIGGMSIAAPIVAGWVGL